MPKAHPIAQEHGQRHETRKPEQHRQGLREENAEFVVRDRVGEAPWHDTQVDEREERPDGAEEEEVDLGGRQGVPVVGPPVADYDYISTRMGGNGAECSSLP